jgi:threonine synthase
VVQAEGSAPLARLFASFDPNRLPDDLHLPDRMAPVESPRTLATAIKIGAPLSWKKALRAVLRSGGKIIAVSEQEIADAKAMIGRDGIGCEPASATTVAGMKRLVAEGHMGRDESVIGVLTGHMLKDPDYISDYHRGTLSLDAGAKGGPAQPQPIAGGVRDAPARGAAPKAAILEFLERRR